ncbi:MAG: fibronectin type III domain-containing protein [Patescibacteria group bacterium]|nr:fibronectin type III domain-containing protein [Patescibacteria group bacterium]
MKKNSLVIFAVAILGLIFFNTDICLALNNPMNLIVETIGEGSAILQWEWEQYGNSGTLKQFKLLYKDMDSTAWTAKYPDEGSGIITYNLMGLSEGTIYQWRIQAQAENPEDHSSIVDANEPFETTSAVPPPNGEGDNGGFLQDISLENPLNQDTLWDAINAVLNFSIIASFAIAPILIIYAAFLMIFAAGDATKISRAKEIILWTVVALAVISFAKGLPSVIKGAFQR